MSAWYPLYTLYLRRSDRAVQVVCRQNGRVMPVRACWPGGQGILGLFVEFYEATGIFLLDEEIVRVDVFPAGLAASPD